MISNPLILPSTGHTGDLGDAQTLVRGSQEVITPQAAQGPNSWEPDLPQPAQGFNPGGYHISACLGICTLIRGCLALRLHPY